MYDKIPNIMTVDKKTVKYKGKSTRVNKSDIYINTENTWQMQTGGK